MKQKIILGICILTLLVIMPLSSSVILEKNTFILGEFVDFEISSETDDIKITNDFATYRLINLGNPNQKFLSQQLGTHIISAYDNGELISSTEFFVVNNLNIRDLEVLRTNKNTYLIGEEVLIEFFVDIEEFDIFVRKNDATYSFIGNPSSPLTFFPASTGIYEVILESKTSNERYLYSFEVIDKKVSSLNIRSSENIKDIAGLTTNQVQTSSRSNIDIPVRASSVNNIRLQNALVNEDSKIAVQDISKKQNLGVGTKSQVVSFAVFSDADFDTLTIESTARGQELYECDNWDFVNELCLSSWNKIKDLTPGEEYEITTSSKNSAYAETGVASVNTKKPIYKTNEVAELLMVVLDTEGYLVMEADVSLEIIAPDNTSINFSTQDQITEINPGVYAVNYTTPNLEGTYVLNVEAVGRNVNSSLSSYFVVKDFYEFDILRDYPVTIDPWQGPYDANIKIVSLTNITSFSFTEKIPNTFTLSKTNGATVNSDSDYIYLTWNDLSNNSVVSYSANSPLITPDLWEIGPSIVSYGNEEFLEERPWLLAIDPITFYDPSSTIAGGWSSGTGTTHTEINGGIRQPTNPGTATYVSSAMNSAETSQFGFPSIVESGIESITLWVFVGTGATNQFNYELRQGTTTVCSDLVPGAFSTAWRSCTWSNPTGSLTDLRLFLAGPTRAAGGGPTDGFVYSAYLEVDTGSPAPEVTLNNPADGAMITSNPFNFQFTAVDETFSTLSCDLYTNISGSWAVTASNAAVSNNTLTSFSQSPADNVYSWNVLCDNSDKSAFAVSNRSFTVNAVLPLIENASLNESSIRQNRTVRFNVDLFDSFGIDMGIITLEYPNSTLQNITLTDSGSGYFADITNTMDPGTYTITSIYTNDTLGQESQNTSPGLAFTVNAIAPDDFDLITPINNEESTELTPTLNWEETLTPDFDNYTILVTKDSSFNTVDFTYNTFTISNTSFTLTSALDANSVYYWKVIAYDIFSNSKNSTSTFTYINDRTNPTVTLTSPDDNAFRTSNPVTFIYTPNDTNTIDYCSLYGNFSGTWSLDQTNTSIVKASTNMFSQTVSEGYNRWNVQCFDLAGNSAFATANRTVILDTTGPVVTLVGPANDSLINDTNIITFVAQSFDELTTVQSCSLIINGSVEQTLNTITENTNFEFEQFLANNIYTWQVSCLDTNGNTGFSEIRDLEVESLDNDPPVISLVSPVNNTYLSSNNALFNYSVSDATGIEYCALYLDNVLEQNDTNIENFEYNTFNVVSLTENSFIWRVECADNSSELNLGISNNRTFTVDLTDPVVILESPTDGFFSSSNNIAYQYTPTDTYLSSCQLYTNESGIFESVQTDNSPSSGSLNTFNYDTSDGTHAWNVLCFDLSGRSSFASNNRSITVDSTAPQYQDITVTPSSPADFANRLYWFNITWSDNFEVDTVLLEHNFTGSLVNTSISSVGDLYSFNVSDLDTGSYRYRWFANDSAANTNQTDIFTYTINKAIPDISLTFNSVEGNLTINQGQSVNIQGSLTTPSTGFLELYEDSVQILNGTAPISTNPTFTTPKTYNYTLIFPQTTNYVEESISYFITVLDITEPVVTLINPSNASSVGTGTVVFSYNVSDDSGINSCSLYINNSLEQTDTSITKDTDQFFSVNISVEDTFSWRVECTDNVSNTGISETRTFTTVDTDAIIINVTTESEYEIGETIFVETTTTDFFSNPLITNVESAIIDTQTTIPWWNSSWTKRKNIVLNETQGVAQTNSLAEVNISDISGSSCNQLRIINHEIAAPSQRLFNVHASGVDWCLLAFEVNLSANEVDNNDFYVYYDNPSATAPSSFLDTTTTSNFYASQAAADEGTPTNVANIIGSNDATFATLSQGGGTGTHSAHGRAFVNSILGTTIYDVIVRYRYSVSAVAGSTLWELRYSTNSGTSYTASLSGSSTTAQTTSSWFNLTPQYSALTWNDVNNTRLQARITKSGGGTNTMEFYWVEINVTHSRFAEVSQTNIGLEQNLINYSSSVTSGSGVFTWSTQSSNLSLGNYSAVSLASADTFTTSSDYSWFEIVPDVTPPNVTLVNPEDESEVGRGNFDFTYFVSDLNLDSCTLYLGTNGTFDIITTDNNLTNNDNNTFSDVFVDLGVYQWNVWCNDTFSNEAFATQNFTLNVSGPDILVNDEDITFNASSLVEGALIDVFANISNQGLTDTNGSFIAQFYVGDPDIDGVQLNENITISNLNPGEWVMINTTYLLQAGYNNIFVLLDSDGEVDDIDLTNNKANNSLTVELYQYYYGNVGVDLVLADSIRRALIEYSDLSGLPGHVLVAHADTDFSFENLQAVTRNIDGSFVAGDFDNVDLALNSTNFKDSIKQVWGAGTNTPVDTETFNLSSGPILNVPVVQSTNNSNFITGILWDTSQDTGNERFDPTDKENIVFITKINPQAIGEYGVYDYEMRVPALLRDYVSGSSKLSFYVEII